MILTSENIVNAYPNVSFESIKIECLSQIAFVKNSLNIGLHSWLKKFVIRRIEKDFTRVFIELEGISSILDKEVTDINPEAYYAFDKILSKYTKLYFKLDKVHFFSSDSTRELCDKIFSEMFSVESKIKQHAFKEIKNYEDSSLLDYAAEMSLRTASNYEPTTV